MIVKELIAHLQAFDGEHHVQIQVDTECGNLKVVCDVEQVLFNTGVCVLYGDGENY